MLSQESRQLPGATLRVFTFVAALFVTLFTSAAAVRADSVCIKQVSSDITLNGVVAQGAGGSCPVGPVWPQIGPVEYLPGGGSPNAYLFLAHRATTNRLFIGIDLKGDPDLSTQDIVFVVFDANNNDIFDAGDFLIKVPIWTAAPIETPAGANCNQVPGPVEVRRFVTGTGWEVVADPEVGAAVLTKLSYDYETTTDAEDKIWNLEISLPLNANINGTPYFQLQTSGAFFGIGSYVFMDTGHHDGVMNPQTGTVLKWPDTMDERTITQQNLFGIPETIATELGDANLTGNCFDVNWTAMNPWTINGFVANAYDNRINRNGNNTFRTTFFFDGPGTTATNMTNNGTVKLSLTPYRASGSGTAWVKTLAVDAQQFNHARTAEFNFDFGNPDPSFGPTSNINFVCATMRLESFQRDDSSFNNSHTVNHNEFITSDYPMDFFIMGDGVPNLKPGESTTVLMRLESTNDPAGAKISTGGVFSQPLHAFVSLSAVLMSLTIFAAGFLAIGVSRKYRFMPKLKPLAMVVAILAVTSLTLQFTCKKRRPSGPVIGTNRWEIKNAKELGITPVKGERDMYEMPIRHGEIKRVQVVFTGRDLPYKTVKHNFNPVGQDGTNNVLRIPVTPGRVATVISFGEIDLDGPNGPLRPTTATGMTVPRIGNTPATVPYLLSEGYYSPNEYAGALIASFDNFQTSFVVGRSASIQVPAQASQLSLSVNWQRGAFRGITGGYEIFVVDNPAPNSPTHTSIQGDATFNIPRFYLNWEVLTSLNVYTYYPTNEVSPDGRRRSQTRNIWGAAHMSVYDTHVRR